MSIKPYKLKIKIKKNLKKNDADFEVLELDVFGVTAIHGRPVD